MRRHHIAGLALVSLLAGGCNPFSLDHDGRAVREDRGPTLASDAMGASGGLVFTADSAEVIYLAQGTGVPALQAIRLADGARRAVDTAEPALGGMLAPTADGKALYYLALEARQGPVYRLREAFSGASLSLDPPPAPGLLVVAPSGRRLLTSTSGGVGAFDLDGGTVTPTPCDGRFAATFAPSGDEVACQTGSGTLVRFRLADQATTSLPGVAGGQWAHAMRWGQDGPSAAFYPALVVGDPGSGLVRARVSPGTFTDVGWHMAYSADGQALAFEEVVCLAGGLLSCSRFETRVMLLDLASGEITTIASGAQGCGGIALSPDGRTVAYVFGSELHVRPTGR